METHDKLLADAPKILQELVEVCGLVIVKKRFSPSGQFYQTRGERQGQPFSLHFWQHRLYDLNPATYGPPIVKIASPYRFGLGPKLRTLREGSFRSWLKGFGYQDIEVGHQDLDFQLTIKGSPEALVAKMLGENASLFVRCIAERNMSLPSSNGREIHCRAKLYGEIGQAATDCSQYIELFCAMASTDFAGFDLLKTLPGAKIQKNSEEISLLLHMPAPVEFVAGRIDSSKAVRSSNTLFISQCRIRNESKLERSQISLQETEELRTLLKRESLAGLHKLPKATLCVEEKYIWIRWDRVVLDTEELLVGANFLASLATPELPYR